MNRVKSIKWAKKAGEMLQTGIHLTKNLVRGPRPTSLAVESTARCNLNCPFCRYGQTPEYTGKTSHSDILRPIGTLDFDLYKERILPSAVEFGTRMIQLHFQGDPLLNKRLVDIIILGRTAGMWMQFFTNGLLMTEDLMDQLIESEVDLVRFSIDGNSQETYELNRVGGDFDKVIQILGNFAEKARQRDSQVKIQWSYIVMRNNEHEVLDAVKHAKELGVEFIPKVLNTTDTSLIPDDPTWHRQFKLKPCTQIYQMTNILWNGDVVPCCYDVEAWHVLGNIQEATLTEIWNSTKYKDFRRGVALAKEDPGNEPEICKTCPMWK